MKYVLPLFGVCLIAACAPIEDGFPATVGAERVTYETGACFGTCPVFNLTIDAEGNGLFVGKRFVAKEGEHRFSASAQQLADFRAKIDAFRPNGKVRYDWENCSVGVMSDMPSVSISWESAQGSDELFWYQGCREPKLQAIKPDLNSALKELPIQELIGSPGETELTRPRGR